MRLKKKLAAFIAAHTSDDFVMTPITMREASLHTAWYEELPKVAMADVVDTVLEGCDVYDVPVLIYIPDTSSPLPVLIYYHGGGFAIDTVAVYDPVCRRIAQAATQHIVISPEYRLVRKIPILQPMKMPWPWPGRRCPSWMNCRFPMKPI